MKSIEQRYVEIKEVCDNAGKKSEADVIIKESKTLEEKLDRLETLARPFAGTVNNTNLVESFQRNFGMTLSEAKIAASDNYAPSKNSGFAWDDIREAK